MFQRAADNEIAPTRCVNSFTDVDLKIKQRPSETPPNICRIKLVNLSNLNYNSDALPLPVQIYQEVRKQIVSEELKPGTRLPSAHDLCRQLKLSKATINRAFELLRCDGYIQTLVGSGAFVRGGIQRRAIAEVLDFSVDTSTAPAPITEAARRIFQAEEHNSSAINLKLDSDLHAKQVLLNYWKRAYNRAIDWLESGDQFLLESSEKSLRCQIAKRLSESRGVVCRSAQVISVSSRRAALDLIARVHIESGDMVAMQAPLSFPLRTCVANQGGDVFDLPPDVGEEQLAALPNEIWQSMKMLYLTPSCGLPVGSTMTLKTRTDLIGLLAEHKKLLVEDDYLVEFSTVGLPIRSLQGMASHSGIPVIHISSAEPVLMDICPAAFLVVPLEISGLYRKAVQQMGIGLSAIDTLILNQLYKSGEYEMLSIRARSDSMRKQMVFVQYLENMAPYASVQASDMLGFSAYALVDDPVHQNRLVELCDQNNIQMKEVSIGNYSHNLKFKKKFFLSCTSMDRLAFNTSSSSNNNNNNNIPIQAFPHQSQAVSTPA